MKIRLTLILILIGYKLLHAAVKLDSILVENIYRTYIIHLPTNYDASQKFPMVMNLHGLWSNAEQQQAYTNFDAVADAENFIMIYPNAIKGNWNVAGLKNSQNDSLFISVLMDSLLQKYAVNKCKIYATGFSEGGFMSYVLACNFADRLAAIAVVSGNMFNATRQACYPKNPIPIMHIHGTSDMIVSYWGIVALERWVPGTVSWWAEKNGCKLKPITKKLPNTNKADLSSVKQIYYEPGSDSCEVIFLEIFNGGHTWPGASIKLPFGSTNKDINASQIIWDFFSRHSLKDCQN